MTIFDDVAEQFTQATDRAIATNNYLRGRLVLDMIKSEATAHKSVLDYGCGPGRLAHLIAREGFAVRAVDTSPSMIARARQLDRTNLDLHFKAIGAEAEALPPNSYDVIVCSSVIEYVVSPDELLRGFRRALRRPGLLVISYANKSSLWRRYWERNAQANLMYTPHNQTWNWPGFKSLLREHGFEPVSAPTFFESPCDWYRFGSLFRRVALAGTVGIVAARPSST
jgi:2-polyprenyl-3-methyl-5-hydroxy-6-metoxy-1,4-benzoquinol methylase